MELLRRYALPFTLDRAHPFMAGWTGESGLQAWGSASIARTRRTPLPSSPLRSATPDGSASRLSVVLLQRVGVETPDSQRHNPKKSQEKAGDRCRYARGEWE